VTCLRLVGGRRGPAARAITASELKAITHGMIASRPRFSSTAASLAAGPPPILSLASEARHACVAWWGSCWLLPSDECAVRKESVRSGVLFRLGSCSVAGTDSSACRTTGSWLDRGRFG